MLVYEPVLEGRFISKEAAAHSTLSKHAAAAQLQQERLDPSSDSDSTSRGGSATGADVAPGSPASADAAAIPAAVQESSGKGQEMEEQAARRLAPAGAEEASAPAPAAHSHHSGGHMRTQRLLRRYLASQATFFFSGIWHWLIFYFASGQPGWLWVAFFTLQGPIIVVEALLQWWARQRGLRLPTPLAIFMTNFLLIVVANPLFFGPCDDTGMCHRMKDSALQGLAALWGALAQQARECLPAALRWPA